MDAFNLLFAGSVLAAGSLSDRFGRKGMMLAGLSVFGVASLAGGVMDTPGQLIAARAVMGVGAAMVFPSTLSLVSNVFTERGERARAIGLWGAITGAAIALGPIVGGWLLEVSDWRSIFFAMAPVAAIAGVLAARYVPTSRDPHAPRTDRAGFALSTAAVALLVYTIIEAPNHGWESTRTLGSFALTAVLAAAFMAWEWRTEHPMLDVSLFRNPRFAAASAALAISFFALSGFIFLVTQLFQFLKGYGPLSTGVRLLPVASFVAIFSILGAKLAVRLGTKLVVASGLERNRAFAAAGGHQGAVVFPKLRLFVITCLDPRVDPAHFLGLSLSDAMVVRNVGGRVTPEVINDVAFIGQLAEGILADGPLLELAVIHHTQRGTGVLADDTFRRRYAQRIGAEESTLREHAVLDPVATVTRDVERLRSAPAISPRVTVSGHVYDVVTGLVETVLPGSTSLMCCPAARPAAAARRPINPDRSAVARVPAHGA